MKQYVRRCLRGARRNRHHRLEQLELRLPLTAQNAFIPFEMPTLEVDRDSYDDTSIIVKFRDEFHAAAQASSEMGAGILAGSRLGARLGRVPGLHRVDLSAGFDVASAIAAYEQNPMVLYAEPNYTIRIAETVPNDSRFSEMWPLNNSGQTGGAVDADIDALGAWDISQGSGSTVVAVIDTGVDFLHPDLAQNMWVNPGEIPGDGIDNDGNDYIDDVYGFDFYNNDGSPMDDHGHGTHVAGTIGAVGNNGLGVTGINWNVQIMALKFLGADGSGTTEDAIEALQYAVANGATISNNSWGGDPYSQALYDAISDARDAGHIFVAAAGNGDAFGIGIDNDANPFYPAGFDLDNIIAVAATDHKDHLAGFSNYGATSVDLAAPGVNILSTTPNSSYGLNSGTSMAAPHVTGVTALVQDLNSGWGYSQVIQQVLGSVDPVPQLYGIVSTSGRLNAANALGNPEPPPPPPPAGDLPLFAGFANSQAGYLQPRVGAWEIKSNEYQTVPMAQNHELFAVSTVLLNDPLPGDVDIRVTMNADEGRLEFLGLVFSDHLTNGFIVFDYHGYDDFKYAGANIKDDQWIIGHRDASGWHTDAAVSAPLAAATDYRMRLLIEGESQVTLYADGDEIVSHLYGESVVDGDVGVSARDSTTRFDNLLIEAYQPVTPATLPYLEDFEDGQSDHLQEEIGSWYITNGRYRLLPDGVDAEVNTLLVDSPLPSDLEIASTIYGESVSGFYHNALIVFDYQNETDFKFAGAYFGSDTWVIGRRTAAGWFEDAEFSETIQSATDYDVLVRITNGTDVELVVGGVSKVEYSFSEVLHDGAVGIGTKHAYAQFDNISVEEYVPPPPPPSTPLPVTEDFDDGNADFFVPQSGSWTVTSSRYRVVPQSGNDALSTLNIDLPLPSELDIVATLNGESVSGYYHNVLVIFDYQSETDFKFAGAYVGGNRWVIGHRTEAGWFEDAEISETITTGADYDVLVRITNGSEVQLSVGGVPKVEYVFADGVNDGAVGVGTKNAFATFDNVAVSEYLPPPPPPATSLPVAEDFQDGIADYFQVHSGSWAVDANRYRVVPQLEQDAISTLRIEPSPPADFEIAATLNGESVSGYYNNALVIFDYQSDTDFKYAGAYVGSGRWVIGHRTTAGWVDDVDFDETIQVGTDYNVLVRISNGYDIQLFVGGTLKVEHSFTDALHDGAVGVGTKGALARFDNITVQEYVPPPPPPATSLPVTESFDDGVADFFEPHLGTWTVQANRYRVVPQSGYDAISTLRIDPLPPADFEISATLNGESVTGYYHNVLLIFDYQSDTNFKFAGAYVGGDSWVIGHRTSAGWFEDAVISETILTAVDYDVTVRVTNGSDVQLLVGGAPKVQHSFADAVNDGTVGLGTKNAFATFDNVSVQEYVPPPPPPSATLPVLENFDDGEADFFQPHSGTWTVASNRYWVVPQSGLDAISTINIASSLPNDLEVAATIYGESVAGYYHNAVIVFDYQSATDFKFAGAYIGGNRWVIGHRNASGWIEDAKLSQTINSATDYDLVVKITNGQSVQLSVNGIPKVQYTFGGLVSDGEVGVGTKNAYALFDDFGVQATGAGATSIQSNQVDLIPAPDLTDLDSVEASPSEATIDVLLQRLFKKATARRRSESLSAVNVNPSADNKPVARTELPMEAVDELFEDDLELGMLEIN